MVEQHVGRVAELRLTDLRGWVDRLSAHATATTTAADDRLAVIGLLERLRAVTAAAQTVEVAALAAESRLAVEIDIATVPRPGVGVARRREHARRRMVAAVAKARRMSAAQAGPWIGFAEHARTDLPAVFGQFAAGELSERRALTVFTAVTPLDGEQRRAVDARVAPKLLTLGDHGVDKAARAAVYAVDPAGVVKRNAYAVTQRRVGVRPAPDCMAFVTTLTTMPTAVAFRAQLEKDAKAARAAGDPRSLGNLMADIAMARVLNPTVTATFTAPAASPASAADAAAGTAGTASTGTASTGTTTSGTTSTGTTGTGTTGTGTTGTGTTSTGGWPAADPTGRPVPPDGAAFTGPVAIQLLITDRTLAGGNEPARFADGEPYPAALARDLALAPGMNDATRTVRRLFIDPAGRIITGETTSRQFTSAMRDLVLLRDGTCTTPWCNAPITDTDHHHPATHGGPTSLTNARGLCRWCNVTKADTPPDDDPPPDNPPPADAAPDIATPADPTSPTPPPCRPGSPVEHRLRRVIRHHHRHVTRRRGDRVVDLPQRC